MSRTFAHAYERIQSVYGIRTQVELADRLGIRQSSISDAKRRGVVPDSWLVTILEQKGVSPYWIKTGEGSQFLSSCDSAPVHPLAPRDINQVNNAELLAELAARLKTYTTPGAVQTVDSPA